MAVKMRTVHAEPDKIYIDSWTSGDAQYVFIQSLNSTGQRISVCMDRDEAMELVRALVDTLAGEVA